MRGTRNVINSMATNDVLSKARSTGHLLSFSIEVTARCNNNCRHCYINLPAHDDYAAYREMSVEEIRLFAEEAASLGAVSCLVTGGEPLLRLDFPEVYLALKGAGLLVSVFTNATLVNKDIIRLFSEYPPRDIEVSVYGVSEETYETVSRVDGSFAAFQRGLDLLLSSGLHIKLKSMCLRSNLHEHHRIAQFCREATQGTYRFDPLLHLRYDRNPLRNKEILSERLSLSEIIAVESNDDERISKLISIYDKLILPDVNSHHDCNCSHLFRCDAGQSQLAISYDGMLRMCSSLVHPDLIRSWQPGNLSHVLYDFFPANRTLTSDHRSYKDRCGHCRLVNLCHWCPAYAYLETGRMDVPVDYFCEVAHARANILAGRCTQNV